MKFTIPIRVKGKNSLVAKIFATLFFFVFFAMGSLFLFFIGKEIKSDLSSQRWTNSYCKIIKSNIAKDWNNGNPYSFEIEYRYQFEGREYFGDKFTRNKFSSDEYEKLQRLEKEYSPGKDVACFVNPKNPSQALIDRSSQSWFFLFIFIPLIFIFIGGFGMYHAIRDSGKSENISSQAKRSSKRNQLPKGIAILFTVGGALSFYFLSYPRLTRYLSAENWISTPARVESSNVISHDNDDDGTTYSIDILYHYQFNGQDYRSNRYTFFDASSSGRSSKYAVIRNYANGKEISCYVNPNDPFQAVIIREFQWFGLLMIGLPLAFLLGGVWWFVWLRKSKRSGIGSRYDNSNPEIRFGISEETWLPKLSRNQIPQPSGEILLKPAHSPLGKILGTLFIMLFWNGIVSVFLYQVYSSYRTGNMEWGLVLFLIPFVLVGIFLIFLFLNYCLSFFNPRPTMYIDKKYVPLGSKFIIRWNMVGNTEKLKEIKLLLTGTEEASYQQGTNRYTAKNVFYTKELLRKTPGIGYRSDRVEIEIPSDTIHSFEASNNKIIWRLKLSGEIPKWPDIEEEYQIIVVP